MKNIFEKLVQLGMIVIFLACCQTCTNDYIEGGENKAISNYKKIISDNSFIIAHFNPIYTEKTVKIAGIPIKTFYFEYFFEIDNQRYEGKKTFTQLPKENEIKVYYLKENPNFNMLDPKKALEEEKEKNNPIGNLYWAVFWAILSLITLGGLVVNTHKIISNKKLESQNIS
jgi:hypothetical protein